MVLPVRPEGSGSWTEDQLAEIVKPDCCLGVALPEPGVTSDTPRDVHPALTPIPNT
jgi:hypothetical protein